MAHKQWSDPIIYTGNGILNKMNVASQLRLGMHGVIGHVNDKVNLLDR